MSHDVKKTRRYVDATEAKKKASFLVYMRRKLKMTRSPQMEKIQYAHPAYIDNLLPDRYPEWMHWIIFPGCVLMLDAVNFTYKIFLLYDNSSISHKLCYSKYFTFDMSLLLICNGK